MSSPCKSRGGTAVDAMLVVAFAIVAIVACAGLLGRGYQGGAVAQARCLVAKAVGGASAQCGTEGSPLARADAAVGMRPNAGVNGDESAIVCDKLGCHPRTTSEIGGSASGQATVCVGGVCRGGNCFVAGTPVLGPDGPVPIESIHEGDVVLARDLDGAPALRRVARVFQTPDRSAIDLGVDGHTIGVTPEHPFFVDGRGWVAAGDLRPGDEVVTSTGHARVVSTSPRGARETVWNFEVEESHTYFVGAVGALVHNDCNAPVAPGFGPKDFERARVAERLGVLDWWLKLTNDQRTAANEAIAAARKAGGEAAVQKLLFERARDAIRDRQWSTPSDRDLMDFRGDLHLSLRNYEDALDESDRSGFLGRPIILPRKRLTEPMPGRRDLYAPMFTFPKPLPENPRMRILGRTPRGPFGGESPEVLANRIAGATDLRVRGKDIVPEDGSWLRVPKNLLKGTVYRSPLGFFWSKEDLAPEKSPEELLNQRLMKEAMEDVQSFEFRSNGAGAVFVRPASDPVLHDALKTVKDNFTLFDTALQRKGGDPNPKPDGLVSRADLVAILEGDYSKELKLAAATLADAETFDKLDIAAGVGGKDGLVAMIDIDAMMRKAAPKPLVNVWSFEPEVVRVWVPNARRDTGEIVEIARWTTLGKEIALMEANYLTGVISMTDFLDFMEKHVVAKARDEAAAAREALRQETDRVLHDAEKVVGEKIFVRALDKELKAGINDRKHAEYLNREWYEKLGVGTWGAVKEVLMIPVGLGELLVYITDHGNPVVLLRGGRNDGSKLLYQMSGEDFGAIPEGIANAFEDWWNAAQAEPDRAIGQTVGFVGTFFIPVTKLSKVTKLTNIAAKSLASAERLKVAGRFVEAEIELARAQRAARTLAELAEAKNAAQGARAAAEEARVSKLAREVEAAVATSQDDLARAARGAKDPFVVAAAEAKAPARALASAPQNAVFRFDPDSAFGELHHIVAAMEANPTLRVYVSASAENKVVQEAAIKYLKEAFGEGRVLTTKAEWKKVDAALQLGLKEGDLQKATGTLRDALARDPNFAVALRERMLGKAGLSPEVKTFVDTKLPAGDRPLLVIWNRTAESAGHGAERAMDPKLLGELLTEAKARGFTPVVMGPKPAIALGDGVVDMTGHWKTIPGVTDQAQMFAYLQQRGAVGQVGMMSGGVDAAAFGGMPTLSITAGGTSDRLGHLVGKLPNYREVAPGDVVGLLKDIPRPIAPRPPITPAPPLRPNPLLPGASKLGPSTAPSATPPPSAQLAPTRAP